jgi:hypothetical protein
VRTALHPSSLIPHHSSLITHHSSLITHHSSLIVTSAYCSFYGRRLPHVWEWQFAASGPSPDSIYPWGDAPPSLDYTPLQNSDADPPPPDRVDGKAGQYLIDCVRAEDLRNDSGICPLTSRTQRTPKARASMALATWWATSGR